MFVQVRLLQYAKKVFTYSVPESLQADIMLGLFVKVPLQNRVVPAIVDKILNDNKTFPFAIKPIDSIYPFPKDKNYLNFIEKVSAYYQIDPLVLFKRVQKFLQEKEKKVVSLSGQVTKKQVAISFTLEQKNACTQVIESIKAKEAETFVLHGVTGSGKTEVYKELIKFVLAEQNSAIVMLPEVTLALQFEKIFAQSLPGVTVIGFHSSSPVSQKRLLWKSLLEKKPVVIVGVHLPVLLPVANLGLIIVDEEHDAGYQEKKHPKVHSRDMAILKASMYNAPILLGSATPSLQSLWNVKKRNWKMLTLQNRFAGSFPEVEVVSLKQKENRHSFWITARLYQDIQDRLLKKEQVIIFLNRRGYSFFVQCPCSFVFSCGQCSVSLTLHTNNYLTCHYCGHKEKLPLSCSGCGGSGDQFLKKGIGTQQIVQVLQKLFPQAVIARADADTTIKKRSWQQTVQDMLAKDIDILVGTQSIAKGYHFPGVTLVGVLWADLNLHFPVYNAAEVALQQLIQVAGRAGRQSHDSKVIIQTFDQHPVYNFINEKNYISFYEQEIIKRKEVGYPPCKHIAEIEIRHTDERVVAAEALDLADRLQEIVKKQDLQVDILGPVQAVVYRVKSVFVKKIMLKSLSRATMIQLFKQTVNNPYKSQIYFTVDPV